MTRKDLRIRPFGLEELEKIRKIHQLYYQDDFDFPDFLHNFHCVFGIEDNENNLITVGGVRPIAEIIAITDKSHSARIRREALYKLLDGSLYIAGQHGYDAVHCFIRDELWKKQLISAGFRVTEGQSLIRDIG